MKLKKLEDNELFGTIFLLLWIPIGYIICWWVGLERYDNGTIGYRIDKILQHQNPNNYLIGCIIFILLPCLVTFFFLKLEKNNKPARFIGMKQKNFLAKNPYANLIDKQQECYYRCIKLN